MVILKFISERIRSFIGTGESGETEEPDEQNFFAREKLIAFGITFIFAFSLWFVVNMNRDYNISVNVPIELVNIPDGVAVSSEVPEHVTVSVSGEGWNLIGLYRNPPTVMLSAESRQINLFEQIRGQSGAFSDLNVIQVEPIVLTIETETKAEKKVPVRLNMDLNLRSRYGLLGDPQISPDSVTVTGAESKLADIDRWDTEEVELSDVSRSIERTIRLIQPGAGLILSTDRIEFKADVAEFTEAEVRVPIRTRNLPSGQAVTYNPSSITVRFDVPIQQYAEVQGTRPFIAFVDYAELDADDTGYITPEIERVANNFHVRLRSFQPPRVSYFNIVPD
jgi:YbbR domain-containing protein